MKQNLLNALCLFVLCMFNISGSKTLWPARNNLTLDDKYYCHQFQILDGSNRTEEFKRIFNLVFANKSFAENATYSGTEYTLQDIRKLLGKPTNSDVQYKLIYTLNVNVSNSQVEFNQDPNSGEIFCTISNAR